ncbi:hypothetical protein DLJ74_18035 [Gracilibacillus dipsosauri]|uniref:ATP-grasp domain-containing protein n=2 Tax=Gracilibacillus dipsosauri TaxID=178340 RepID=A0A317KUE6_9BACI|nr:hypothetical protein DLJ74_18035 [Gracilibacillus dipsosauri]
MIMDQLRIKEYTNPKPRIIVPHDIYRYNTVIRKIKNGPYSTTCECLSHYQRTDTIYISSALMQQLHLQNNHHYSMRFIGDTCVITYTLGIFIANSRQLHRSAHQLKEIVQVGEKYGFITYVFGYKDVDLSKQKIQAYQYYKQQWLTTNVDIPFVIYNRIPNRKLEAHHQIKKIKQGLQSTSIIFNHDFFNKWQVYEYLFQDNESRHLLPQAIFQPSEQSVKDWLNSTSIYLKPLQKYRGEESYLIVKRKEQFILIQTDAPPNSKEMYFPSFDLLKTRRFPKGFQHYVMEEAHALFTYHDSEIIFRVNSNKNENNKWVTTLIAAYQVRHSNRSNLVPLSNLFTEKEEEAFQIKIAKMAVTLSKILENRLDKNLGELAFDVAIDKEKRTWLLDVYSRPSWRILDHGTLYPFALDMIEHLFRYSFYLHNQKRMNLS